jgi:probable F420-dependent oxidoreductase
MLKSGITQSQWDVHSMKFGLMAANLMGNVEGAAVAEIARAAEEVGFHSIWVAEHAVVPVEYASTYPYDEGGRLFKGSSQLDIADPLIWLAFAAAVTTKIRLATGILILPQRNPVVAAKEIASLDRLSNGRLDLGIGSGWLREEFDALGVPFEARGARTDEYLRALRVLWSDTEAEFHGEFVDFAPVYCQPKPSQSAIPILVGGHSDRAARRAGELGDVFFPAERPVETLEALYSAVKQYADDAGRDPSAIELWTTSTGDREHLEQLIEVGVTQVMVPARSPEQLQGRYAQLIVDYSTR